MYSSRQARDINK
jgi:hypothetical protein